MSPCEMLGYGLVAAFVGVLYVVFFYQIVKKVGEKIGDMHPKIKRWAAVGVFGMGMMGPILYAKENFTGKIEECRKPL